MTDDELLTMAALVGLDAVDDQDLDSVTAAVEAAAPAVRADYQAAVRGTREAMARVSESTAVTPPETLRDRVMAAVHDEPAGTADGASVTSLHARRRRTRIGLSVAAALLAVAAGALGWLLGARGQETPSKETTAARVLAASDVASRSGAVATGRATVTYSDSADAAVLVMNDVPPPAPGTVYQMWLAGPDGTMTPAGTMTDKDVAPSTTAVLTGVRDATALAFTVEPPGGSTRPTSPVVAQLPLK
ncbi:MAG: anti-sigma factor [Gordonia sp. (in: high G+C Gram-positive bacteria)]|uniref:anti-sigma factor n=1 Tax=Gordonia sp. (in: high G+C Gram-positive bacteria) TaxID=84139 RepID=UPI0039E45631